MREYMKKYKENLKENFFFEKYELCV